ncbi:MAG: hypothetical protein AMXMBFR85_07920 [Dehalococcoides mccartyi]|uniref:Uncharacterized protein n=1 Tax=Dehalococcoides mccartyi TaxID=61435 RepID=A0AB33HS50_9CHLR|nr:hypothetical protein [Dehalococcoides mccartyi]MEA4879247.1 hypothetical protein [Dehalococcoides mccartyi]BAZ97296.1 hypothetical protein DEHALATV1_0668 [Dehalococcoides mccartyi]
MTLQGTEMQSQSQTGDIMHWILAIIEKVNQDGKLAPNKAVQLRMQETIGIYGSAKVWEAIKQFSINLGSNKALLMEELFQKYPDFPDLFDTDKTFPSALNQWFEHHSIEVNRFHRVASAILKANPAVEWEFDTSSDTDRDLTPIMDMLFRNTEAAK